jgi:hypothetical protein
MKICRPSQGFLQPIGRILFLTVALGLALNGQSQTTPMSRPSFPQLEAATPECRAVANAILTNVIEREGLYTLFGGLKPMSYVTVSGYRERSGESLSALMQRYVDAAAALSDDDLTFRMQFWNERTPRVALVYVFRHSLVRAKIHEHAATFAAERIEAGGSMRKVVDRVMEHDFQDVDRMTGLLFGFPEHAVDFFCHPQKYYPPNTLRRLEGDRGGVRIETHDRGSAFVYVLPKQGEYATADVGLVFAARPVLAEFRRRRALHVDNAGALDAVGLVRRWTSDAIAGLPGAGTLAPPTAPPSVAPASGTRDWKQAWTGGWAPARPGAFLLVAITDDGEPDSLRFEFTVASAQHFQFRMVRESTGEGVRLVPVTSTNSSYEEGSFVIERSDDAQWRLRSKYNQRYRDERERARKASNVTSSTASALSEGHDWGAFKRAPSVREAIARGRSEHWARPLPTTQTAGTTGTLATSPRPETEPIVFDSRWDEFGLYLREFSAVVRHRMYTLLLENAVRPPRATACEVRFTLSAQGEVSRVTPQGQVYSPKSLEIARDALQGIHRPWTPEMVTLLGDQQNITFRFYFDY